MFRINKEILKSYILLIFIIGSFVQVKILWDLKDQGLPFKFLSAFVFKNGQNVPTIELKDNFSRPYRIIVSEGYGESHWVLTEDHDEKSDYQKLWNELKLYLNDIFDIRQSIKPVTQDELYKQWDKLIQSKIIIFEYRANIKLNLLSYMIRNKNIAVDEPVGVYKIAISPWEDINEKSNTLYILDGNTKENARLYKFTLPISEVNKLSKQNYDETMKRLKKLTNEGMLRSYSIFKESNPRKDSSFPIPISDDIPIVNYGDKYESFYSIHSYVPKVFEVNKGQEANEIAEFVLGSEKYSYQPSEDISGNIVFMNLNSIYKINKKGLLEYKYTSENLETEKGSEVSAFENAIAFISKANLLQGETEIHLSSIKYDEKDRYRFTFDYQVADIPVFVNFKLDTNETGTADNRINNAITIEANSKRVLSCKWLLRDFSKSREPRKSYSVFFVDLWDGLAADQELFNSLKTKGVMVKDISVSYEVTSETEDYHKIEPSWLITTEDNRYFPVRMKAKK